MKNVFKPCSSFKSILLVTIIMIAVSHLNAQPIKPSDSGYAPVNGIKVYYEVYGEGMPVILLHGAFMTINLNWSQLIPELAKTRKVIAIELEGHGHTPFTDRKLSFPALATDVEGVMDYL